MQFSGENIALTKTRQQLQARLPPADSAFVETWLYQMRPLLVRGEVRRSMAAGSQVVLLCMIRGHFFVKRDGRGPRADIAYTSRQVMERYIGASVSPHTFRAMQVS